MLLERTGMLDIGTHALMQLRGLVLILVGAGAIVYNKVLHGKHHFVSLHAKVSVFLELAFFCRR